MEVSKYPFESKVNIIKRRKWNKQTKVEYCVKFTKFIHAYECERLHLFFSSFFRAADERDKGMHVGYVGYDTGDKDEYGSRV